MKTVYLYNEWQTTSGFASTKLPKQTTFKYPFVGDQVRNLHTLEIATVNAIEYTISGTRFFLLSNGKTYLDFLLADVWQIYNETTD